MNKLEASIIIPLLTILAFGGIYYYELGFFIRLNLPTELIQIEPTKNVFLIFIFLATVISSTVFLEPYRAGFYMIFDSNQGWIPKIFLILIYSAALFLIFFPLDKNKWLKIDLVPLYIMLIFSVALLIKKATNEPDNYNDFYIFLQIKYRYGQLVGSVLLSTVIISLIMYDVGYISANSYFKRYLTYRNRNEIILRLYSDKKIIAELDSNNHIRFIILQSSNINDTFSYNSNRKVIIK